MASKYDKYRNEWLNLWLYEGLTTRQIAERYDPSRPTVTSQLKKTEVRDFKARCYYRADEVERHYQLGWSLTRLGNEFHCSPSKVRGLLIKRGYDTSTQRSRSRELSMEERFWQYVDEDADFGPDGECWKWKAGHSTTGYGVFHTPDGQIGAHRYSYELHSGEKLGDLFACHHCDNKGCVNPDHLYAGTPQDNADDAVKRGRILAGSAHPQAKICEDIAAKIASYRNTGTTAAVVAERFADATEAIVYNIWSGSTWTNR